MIALANGTFFREGKAGFEAGAGLRAQHRGSCGIVEFMPEQMQALPGEFLEAGEQVAVEVTQQVVTEIDQDRTGIRFRPRLRSVRPREGGFLCFCRYAGIPIRHNFAQPLRGGEADMEVGDAK